MLERNNNSIKNNIKNSIKNSVIKNNKQFYQAYLLIHLFKLKKTELTSPNNYNELKAIIEVPETSNHNKILLTCIT